MATTHDDDDYTLKRTKSVINVSSAIDRTTSVALSTLSKTESTIKQKFSYIDWATIEKTLLPNEINVLKMLTQYMDNLNGVSHDFTNQILMAYKIIGNNIYVSYIRNKLVSVLKLNETTHQTHDETREKPSKKKGISKNEIILKTLEKSIKIFIDTLSTKKKI